MDIVERLRLGGPNAWEVYGEAADEIDRLSHQLAEARAELNMRRASFPDSAEANMSKPMTLFISPEGPLIQYANGVLHINDLNPEVKTKWRMSRGEMIAFGFRCLLSALRR